MKRLLLISLVFFGSKIFPQSNIDVLHYRFYLALNDENDTIYGAADIDYILKEKSPSVKLDLGSLKKDGKGMIVTYHGNFNGIKQEDDQIIINTASLNKNDTATLTINYKGIVFAGFHFFQSKASGIFGEYFPYRDKFKENSAIRIQ